MKKRLIIIGVTVAITAAVLLFAYYSNSPSNSANTNTNPETTTEGIIFDEETLINRGVTSGQMDNLKQSLGQYLSSENKKPRRVSFGSIRRPPPNPKTTTPLSKITFVIQLDGKSTYKAMLDAFSLSEIRLYLYDPNDRTLLYDSQNIGGSSG